MNTRVGSGVRSRDHRRYQFPADFVSESVPPSSGKYDLSGETFEASWHSETDLFVGNIAPTFVKDGLSGGTVEASSHFCANLFLGDSFLPFGGRDLFVV